MVTTAATTTAAAMVTTAATTTVTATASSYAGSIRSRTHTVYRGYRTIIGRGKRFRFYYCSIFIINFGSGCPGTGITLIITYNITFAQATIRFNLRAGHSNGLGLLRSNLNIIITGVFITIQGNSQLGTAHTGLNINRIIRGVTELEVQSGIIHSGILSNRYVRRGPQMIISGYNFQVGANDSTIQGSRGLADTAAICLNRLVVGNSAGGQVSQRTVCSITSGSVKGEHSARLQNRTIHGCQCQFHIVIAIGRIGRISAEGAKLLHVGGHFCLGFVKLHHFGGNLYCADFIGF